MQSLHSLLDEYPDFLPQESETSTMRTPIPIYYIHSLRHPYCKKPLCPCQRQRHEAARLMGFVAEGDLLLADAALLMDERREVVMSSTTTPPLTRIYVELISGVPEACQLYGHQWEYSELPGTKECSLCGIRGYCPRCVFIQPPNAQPFHCTAHTPRNGERK